MNENKLYTMMGNIEEFETEKELAFALDPQMPHEVDTLYWLAACALKRADEIEAILKANA